LLTSGAGGEPLGKPCHELGMLGGRQAKVDHGSSEGEALNAGFSPEADPRVF